MRKLRKSAAPFLLMAPLLGCSQNIVGTVEQMCDTLPPISVSKCDVLTDDTAREIEADNVAKETWCGIRQIEKKATSCKRIASLSPSK